MNNYFKDLLALLAAERVADETNFTNLTASTSATQRRALGLCWYPIAIRNTEPSRGDYLSVEVERTTHKDLPHQLRFGSSAALFSNHDNANRVNGTITFVGAERLKVTLLTEELPDWASDGKLGIDLLFDSHSYDEMQTALKIADKADTHLVRVLTGSENPVFAEVDYHNSTINSAQEAAVKNILGAQDLAIIHGPPGTGKTTTLVAAITALIEQGEPQILVVAPSNTAVDLLSDKLTEKGLNVLRIGNPVRVTERLQKLTLESRMAEHSQLKEVKKLKKMAAEFKNMAHKYKRSFGKAEREQRKALFDEAHRIMKDAAKIEEFVSADVICKAQVITATLVGANHYTIKDLTFKTVIMDEAGQALEPAAWIPVLKAQRVVLAGDHLQLPPTVKSAQGGLTTTLLEKCVALHPKAVVLLNEQYRMNTAIAFITIGSLGSCKKFLDVQPKNAISDEFTIVDKTSAETAVRGVYRSLGAPAYYGETYVTLGFFPGGDVISNTTGGGQNLININFRSDEPLLSTSWAAIYTTVNRANQVIAKLPGVQDATFTNAYKNQLLGEAYFVRALAYFDLARAWGGVQLKLQPTTSVNSVTVPRSTQAETYAQVLKTCKVQSHYSRMESIG